jgi:hypothetical protein
VLPLASGLCACVTTQQKNARTVLLNERTLASQQPVQVTHENPSVKVAGVALVRGSTGAALAVRLLNTSKRPLSDLPISVGVISPAGRKVYLNRSVNLNYYDAHVAAIASGRLVTWVFTDRRALSAGRPFAEVGLAHAPASTTARSLPRIDVAQAAGASRGVIRVTVSNQSGIPQYGLQIYGLAVRNGRYVGAARATVPSLDGGSRATIVLRLLGTATGATVRVYALPTIFE